LIDINEASDELLASMFESLGFDQTLRNQLVDSIVDWRDIDDVPSLNGAELNDYGQVIIGDQRLPRNGPFQSLDELLLVKHMTPEIFYGRVEFNQTTQTYKRIPGVRDIVTLSSGIKQVNVNIAATEVLAALPKMTPQLIERILAERSMVPFKSADELLLRVPELLNVSAYQYLTTNLGDTTGIVSVATVRPSGASRTVHLDFRRDRKKQILVYSPLIYKDVEVINFQRWRF